LQSWYNEIADLVRYSNYSLTEIKTFLPYEFTIFQSLLLSQIDKEKKAASK